MARRRRRPPAEQEREVCSIRTRCVACGGPLWVAYHSRRTITTLESIVRLRVQVRHCVRLRPTGLCPVSLIGDYCINRGGKG